MPIYYQGNELGNMELKTDYVLPIASSSVLGGVKIGEGINISEDGTISVNGGGSEEYELIAHSDEILESVLNIKISLDDNGETFQLKRAVLYVWISVNGIYSYKNVGMSNDYSWLTTYSNSGVGVYRCEFFKDANGNWAIRGGRADYSDSTMLPTSNFGNSIGQKIIVSDEYLTFVHFECGNGSTIAKYSLYGIRG